MMKINKNLYNNNDNIIVIIIYNFNVYNKK
jgi:hypothetical protein